MGFGCGETWDGIATLPLLTGYISQPLRVSASYLNTVKVKWPNGLYNLFFLKKEKMKNMCFRCLAQFTAHRRSFRTMASCLSRGSRRSRLRGKSSGASDSFRRWFQEPGGWVSKHATATRLELNSTGALWARVWRTRLGYLPTG